VPVEHMDKGLAEALLPVVQQERIVTPNGEPDGVAATATTPASGAPAPAAARSARGGQR